MFIKRKDWERLNKKVKELETRVNQLESISVVNSFYFGTVTFPYYVRLTEKEINRLKSDSTPIQTVDKRELAAQKDNKSERSGK